MNSTVRHKAIGSKNKGSQLAHTFRTHDLKPKGYSSNKEIGSGAVVIRAFREPVLKLKAGTSDITSRLSTYRNRYNKAMKEGKPDIAAANLDKVNQLEAERKQRRRKRKPREAELIDSSWSITEFPPKEALAKYPDILQRMSKLATKILLDEFPMLTEKEIGVAGHIDQATIHIHTAFNVPEDQSWTSMLNGVSYSTHQQLWNEALKKEFPDLPIGDIKLNTESGAEYLDLATYKQITELKEMVADRDRTIEELKAKIEELSPKSVESLPVVRPRLSNGNVRLEKAIEGLKKPSFDPSLKK